MKEHAGGTPNIGYEIPISAWDEEAYPVAIEQFKFHELDKPEDFIIEAVKQGRNSDVEAILKCVVRRASALETARVMATYSALLLEADKPRRRIHCLVWAVGMNLCGGKTCDDIATEWGVSKQAVVQEAHRMCEKLMLKPCRAMRDEAARLAMSERNYRPRKTKKNERTNNP